MFAPAGLAEKIPAYAAKERISKTADLDGYLLIVAYDKKAELFLAQLFDAAGEVVRVWRIGDQKLSEEGWPKILFRPHGAAIAPNGDIFVNSDADEALSAGGRNLAVPRLPR